MSKQAAGGFEVKLEPQQVSANSVASGSFIGTKVFSGDFVGTSRLEMWTVLTGIKDSAGYVAIEQLNGTLLGRHGTFKLIHQATMRQGADSKSSLVVVPDSGTDGLVGIAGTMRIEAASGAHRYLFDYTLPDVR